MISQIAPDCNKTTLSRKVVNRFTTTLFLFHGFRVIQHIIIISITLRTCVCYSYKGCKCLKYGTMRVLVNIKFDNLKITIVIEILIYFKVVLTFSYFLLETILIVLPILSKKEVQTKQITKTTNEKFHSFQ